MKNPDLFSMFLEIVGYLVLCGSAGYLIVHAIFSIDSLAIWAVKKWRSRKANGAVTNRASSAEPASPAVSVSKEATTNADKPVNHGSNPQS